MQVLSDLLHLAEETEKSGDKDLAASLDKISSKIPVEKRASWIALDVEEWPENPEGKPFCLVDSSNQKIKCFKKEKTARVVARTLAIATDWRTFLAVITASVVIYLTFFKSKFSRFLVGPEASEYARTKYLSTRIPDIPASWKSEVKGSWVSYLKGHPEVLKQVALIEEQSGKAESIGYAMNEFKRDLVLKVREENKGLPSDQLEDVIRNAILSLVDPKKYQDILEGKTRSKTVPATMFVDVPSNRGHLGNNIEELQQAGIDLVTTFNRISKGYLGKNLSEYFRAPQPQGDIRDGISVFKIDQNVKSGIVLVTAYISISMEDGWIGDFQGGTGSDSIWAQDFSRAFEKSPIYPGFQSNHDKKGQELGREVGAFGSASIRLPVKKGDPAVVVLELRIPKVLAHHSFYLGGEYGKKRDIEEIIRKVAEISVASRAGLALFNRTEEREGGGPVKPIAKRVFLRSFEKEPGKPTSTTDLVNLANYVGSQLSLGNRGFEKIVKKVFEAVDPTEISGKGIRLKPDLEEALETTGVIEKRKKATK